MSFNELRAITTFVRTVQLGSLSKSAQAQQITPQAASKALAQLEQHLGVRLFHRSTRSMALTEEGLRFMEAVHPSLVGFEQALLSTKQSSDALAGPLRIVGPRTVLGAVIGPLLDEYARLYPEVRPDVFLDDHIGNWVEDRIDVGFRLGSPPQDGLVARRLFRMQLLICAAPTYLRKYGMPNSLYDLNTHRLSGFRRPSDGRVVPWSIKAGDGFIDHPINPSFSTNDEALELRAVLAGEVIGQLAVPTIIQHLRAGRLVPLLVDYLADQHSLYLYYGSRIAQPARVRRFIDLAIERLGEAGQFVLEEAELGRLQTLYRG